MPCRDDGRIPIESAALCAIMRVLVQQKRMSEVLSAVDWDAAGVTEDELYAWWQMHKAADKSPSREW